MIVDTLNLILCIYIMQGASCLADCGRTLRQHIAIPPPGAPRGAVFHDD
ncbi:MAG: hypothetical protein ACTXOO_03365 [Sodalis sp. (in: enterobacteria)]